MERTLDEKLLEHVETFGALKYDNKRMASILQWDLEEVNQAMKDPDSVYRKQYDRGRLMAEYRIDKKLFELALAGNFSAIERLTGKKKGKDDDDV